MIDPWKSAAGGTPDTPSLLEEVRELRARLEEAEETLEAIRRGAVDALVVSEQQGEKVYTLKSADRLYRLMIEEMGQGAVTLAPDGILLYCNRCFASILKLPLESVLGVSVYTLVAPESRETFGELLRQAEGSGSSQGEVHLRTADSGLVPAYVAATALTRDESPTLCLVVTDLTQQKAAAEAEAANQAKDHFLASLSHELRTPLTPVLALVSGLEGDGRLPQDVQGQLAMIRRNLELEARLIDDLLDLTRIRRGKLALRRAVADLRQILEHAVETAERDILLKRLRLVTELTGEDCRLWGDAPRLTQVFWNLLNNAVKFTPEEGRVTLRLWRDEGPETGCRLVVEVADTGVGIEAETQEHIFDAFDQGRPGTARRFGGLGLGLAISRAIVERHGGSLEVASGGRGQGSTFTVKLPLGDLAAPGPEEAPVSPEGAPWSAGLRRILLVEDHVDTAQALAELLRGLGYEVVVAGTVATALAAAGEARGEIDLVVSDLGLPDGSGLDLMRELSSRHGLHGIALSGYGMEEDIQKSREAGFAMHVTKPVSLQALLAALLQAGEGR